MFSHSKAPLKDIVCGMVRQDPDNWKKKDLNNLAYLDPANSTNTVELSQYCGGYINEAGETVPYKLKNNESAPWSKGFICENGLICEETGNPFGGTISFDNIFESMLLVMIITGGN